MGSAAAVVGFFFDLHNRNVHEEPDGSNCTEITQEYGPIGGTRCYAWCCATCYVACKRTDTRFPKTALVAAAVAAAKRGEHGLTWVPKNGEIRAGDFPCYDWKGNGASGDMHIAVVINPGTQAKFETLGANERNRVDRTWRDRTYVMGFIRPSFDGGQPTPQPVPEEDDDMAKLILVRSDKNPDVYLTDNVTFARKVNGEGSVKPDKGYPAVYGPVVIVETSEMARVTALPDKPTN